MTVKDMTDKQADKVLYLARQEDTDEASALRIATELGYSVDTATSIVAELQTLPISRICIRMSREQRA